MKTVVYINWGRFIAECQCGSATEVHPGQREALCVQDPPGHLMSLVWPDGIERVMAVLAERLSDKRRNWFPADHPVALRLGQPHGESLDDLRAEAEAGEAADAARLAERRAHLFAELRAVGATTEEALEALKGS
jgi:hypothetical protein